MYNISQRDSSTVDLTFVNSALARVVEEVETLSYHGTSGLTSLQISDALFHSIEGDLRRALKK